MNYKHRHKSKDSETCRRTGRIYSQPWGRQRFPKDKTNKQKSLRIKEKFDKLDLIKITNFSIANENKVRRN